MKPAIRRISQSLAALYSLTGLLGFAKLAQAEVTPDNTAGSTTTFNEQNGTYNIDGGVEAGNNLIHSFEQFSIGAEQTAKFNVNNTNIQNILSRITGGSPSEINGIIKVAEGSSANLFLMNPAGIVFGAGASLDVPGSFTATTATSIGLDNDQWFNATGQIDASQLTGNPNNSFAFNTSEPGGIVSSANLTVDSGNLALIGGTVVSEGTLSAPDGQVTIATVPGNTVVRLSQPGMVLNLEFEPVDSVSGNPGSWDGNVASLPQLLTGGGIDHATQAIADADGEQVILSGSGITVNNGDVVATGKIRGQDGIGISGNRITTGELDTSAQGNNLAGDISLLAIGNIETGDIRTEDRGGPDDDSVSVQISSRDGDITTKNIFGNNSGRGNASTFTLEAPQGDIYIDGAIRLRNNGNGEDGQLNWFAQSFQQKPGEVIDPSRDVVTELNNTSISNPLNSVSFPPFSNSSGGDQTDNSGGEQTDNSGGDNGDGLGDDFGDVVSDLVGEGQEDDLEDDQGNGLEDDQGDVLDEGEQDVVGGGQDNLDEGEQDVVGGGQDNLDEGQGQGGTDTTANSDTNTSDNSSDTQAANSDTENSSQTYSRTYSRLPSTNTNNDDEDEENCSADDPSCEEGDVAESNAESNNSNSGNNNSPPTTYSRTPTQASDTPSTENANTDTSNDDGDGGETYSRNSDTTENSEIPEDNSDTETVDNNTDNTDPTETENANTDTSNDDGGETYSRNPNPDTPDNSDTVNNGGSNPTDSGDNSGIANGNSNTPESSGQDTTAANNGNGTPSETSQQQASNQEESSTSSETDNVSDRVDQLEAAFTQEFQTYLQQQFVTRQLNLQQISEQTRDIEQVTGLKTAVIYVSFVPQPMNSEANACQAESAPAVDRRFGYTPSASSNCSPEDNQQLELVLITANGEAIQRRVPNAIRAEVLAETQKFQRTLSDRRNLGSTNYLDSAQKLYQWLIEPLADDLEARQIQGLMFAMDSGLRSLPIAALHDGDNFLIENYSVNLIPSFSLMQARNPDIRSRPVLAMGASKFLDLQELPYVPLELSTITEYLWKGKAFLNEKFTFQNLQEQISQNEFGIIHLATHAEFKPGNPENSYIQLWNRKLRLNELKELGLSDSAIDLLVLSACRTALGNQEAELGFAGSALQAGVDSTLATLWYVSDEGALGVTTEFYRQLSQVPIKSEALRRAQLAMIRGEVSIANGQLNYGDKSITLPPEMAELAKTKNLNFSHPYYWAPFTLIGNPQ
ncbi:MAG: CHAT domain-containing protein [Coleofasciculus sp. B1-GNL1-01]|uniref:CHAT domain-containing protein n=1 Tax=Coleofasciculus sp. B1-GNL1-01 TaxID=3068484 RepID=UPI0032FA03A0